MAELVAAAHTPFISERTWSLAYARIAIGLCALVTLALYVSMPLTGLLHSARESTINDLPIEPFALAGAWALGLLWLFLRREARTESPRLTLWLTPLMVRTVWGLVMASTWDQRAMIVPWVLVSAWLLVRLPRGYRGRGVWCAAASAVVTMLIVGVAMVMSVLRTETGDWSIWADLRPGESHAQFPLTRQEAFLVGWVLTGASGAGMVALLWRGRRIWRARAEDVPKRRAADKLACASGIA